LQNLFPLTKEPIIPVKELEVKNKDLILQRKKMEEERLKLEITAPLDL